MSNPLKTLKYRLLGDVNVFYTPYGILLVVYGLYALLGPKYISYPLFAIVGRRLQKFNYHKIFSRLGHWLDGIWFRAGILLHCWTTFLAFSTHGFWAGLVTLPFPWASDAIWFFLLHRSYSIYAIAMYIWAGVYLLSVIFNLFAPEEQWSRFDPTYKERMKELSSFGWT